MRGKGKHRASAGHAPPAEEELHFEWADLKAKIKQLLNEMLWFYHSQRDDVQLSFESLIQAQMLHYKEMMET